MQPYFRHLKGFLLLSHATSRRSGNFLRVQERSSSIQASALPSLLRRFFLLKAASKHLLCKLTGKLSIGMFPRDGGPILP